MSFTRKHYEETARIIREHRTDVANVDAVGGLPDLMLSRVARDLSAMFAADNPRFDAERFAKACEPGSGK